MRTNSLGIDTARPGRRGRPDSGRRGVMQQAYRGLVAGTPEALAADTGDLWDSGRVPSDEIG